MIRLQTAIVSTFIAFSASVANGFAELESRGTIDAVTVLSRPGACVARG